jgi:hypothetical protein
VSVALQQGFWWGFILFCGWACIAPFCVNEFRKLMSSLSFPPFGRSRLLYCFDWDFQIVFGLFASAVEGKGLLVATVHKFFSYLGML